MNQGDCQGRTPFHVACQLEHEEAVKILLSNSKEIDVTKKTNPGNEDWNEKTAAEIAEMKGKEQLADLIEDYQRNPAGVMIILEVEKKKRN